MTEEDKKMYFDFLERVRKTGKINMFGSGQVLQEVYGLNRYEAKDIVLEWMKTYERKNYEQ